MTRTKTFATVLISFYLAFGSLTPLLPSARAASSAESNETEATPMQSASPAQAKGLRFRLSEGREERETPAPSATPARAEKISDDEARKIFERLPPLKVDESDEKDFNLRDRSLPVPRTGETVLATFPVSEERPAPDTTSAPFQVLRHSPVGDVPIAPQMSITFSEPMVAITSLAELDTQTLPVRLSPQPAGRWRWLGTRTLIFDPAGERLPMATVYTASIAAGTRSANGGTIKSPVTWTFSTPAPQMRVMHPQGSPARRDALMFVEFDQKIDPEAVLRTIKVHTGNNNFARLRLATDEEVAADETVKSLAAAATAGRWLAFRAVTPGGETRDAFPGNTGVTVQIGPGTPSAEGPRVTEQAQNFSFHTFGPLRISSSECGYERRCSPFDSFDIYFTNPLAPEAFDASQVRITPELPTANVVVNGNVVQVFGTKKARRLYKVTFDPALRDIFGQTLGASEPVSFQVGAADVNLYSSGGQFVVLDPAGGPRFSVYSVNHATLKVSLYAVTPSDWWRYGSYMRYVSGYYDGEEKKQTTPPGRRVFSKTIKLEQKPDELVETRIDLTPALKDGWGNVFVIVEDQRKRKEDRETVFAWVQRTRIGLDAFADMEELVGWATSLETGQPLAGVDLRIVPSGATGTTGADGVARLPLATTASERGMSLLVARRGDEEAFLPEQPDWWQRDTGWLKRVPGDHLRWFVFDDRKMYRPGEEVRIKGWIRRVGAGKGGDIGPLAGAAQTVSYTLRDSHSNEITKGTAQINALGGFDLSLKLTPTMNLGNAYLQLNAAVGNNVMYGHQHAHSFQVQEFRRPEFEVTARASEGPHFVGTHAQATVSASYYAGGGLPDSQVVWNVTSTPGHFTPPNRDDFTFGKWFPWWEYHDPNAGVVPNTKTHTGKTDAAGRHHLRIDFDGVNPPQPSSVVAEASVTDVNRQRWTSRATMLVHPADLYVGIRSERTFVRENEPFVVETIVTDLDGRAVSGRDVQVRAAMLEWVFDRGKWSQKEKPTAECAVRSGAEAVKCTLQTKGGGVYRVTARVMDDRERPNESELTLWVAGGTEPPRRDVAQEKVTLIPDRKEYRSGQVAEILVQAPFTPAEGVLTLRRSGLVRTERFTMNEPSHLLRIPIDGAFTPNINVQVDLVGSAPRATDVGATDDKLPRRPAFAVGTLSLPVPPHERRLNVVATPREPAVEPGSETTVAVEVKDAAGRPVARSELAVVVVDESVLALSNYRLDDPLGVFYSLRETGVTDHYLRRSVQLSNPVDLQQVVVGRGTAGPVVGSAAETRQIQELVTVTAAESSSSRPARPASRAKIAPSAAPRPADGLAQNRIDSLARDEGALADGDANAAIRMRENFNALAVFVPSVPTDSMGRAEVRVKVPDNLTRYRVMAVSVAGGRQFGSGESAITARMPLMARPSAPRFLNFGDRFELPVVLQNQTDRPADVRVAMRASNAEMTDGMGRRVTVPANDRVEVRFPVAAMKAGTARFQVGAVTGRHTDAAEISLPVWTPATTEAFATYGELDASGTTVVQPVKAPANVFTQFGGLEVTTSSTQLQALTDAVLYIVAYPYECSEQLSSRILTVAALRDVLTAFKAKDMPTPDEMKTAVVRDIKRLEGRQNNSGGFGFWKRDDDAWPYVSIHVAHALTRAKEKGFDVPDQMLERSRGYLRNIERHIPSYYGRQARNTLIAYSLYVRARMNDRDAAKARRLIATEGLDKLSSEAVGWLYAVLTGDAGSRAEVEAIRKLLNNRVAETAGAAHFVTDYSDDNYLLLHSSRRADGIILEALIGDQPRSDLVSKLVRGLLAHRKRGRWENTQENVFILLALDRYFNTYERATPDFVARAWLGDSFAGEQKFVGRSTDYRQVNIPMRALAEGGATKNLVINKEGQGRLYYRVGMQYAPTSLRLEAADNGFAVERVYEAVDDAADVRRDADGTWRVKAGAKVRVRLTMVAPARRYHVALVDPMPAGLEAMNPELAVTGTVPPDQKRNASEAMRGWWWWRNWFEHQNMRDERVEAFTSLLWEGVYTYTYVTRATTPGAFVVPPAKAEEMYHPETFGRGATDRLVVE